MAFGFLGMSTPAAIPPNPDGPGNGTMTRPASPPGGNNMLNGLRSMFTWSGFTPPEPPAEDVKPPVDQLPIGASGRAHFNGFIQFDELLQRLIGVEGLAIFDRMYRSDPHIRRNVLAIWSPIVNATWEVSPFGGEKATDQDKYAAELCEWALMSYMRPNLIGHLNTVGPLLIRSGYVPFEQIWATTKYKGKTVILPRKLDVRLPRTIWKWYQDDYGELSGVEQLLPNAASVLLPASELVYYRLQIEGDNWVGTSLLRQAYKPWFYKEHFEKIDAIGQERKAVGVPIVYPPVGVHETTKEQVETVLANLHVNQAGYLMMPGPKAGPGVDPGVGWTTEIITFDSSSGDSVKSSIEAQVEAIAAAFLADFLELGHHQVGAKATAEVQDDPFLGAVGALGGMVVEPLNELCARIAKLNVPGIEGAPTLKMTLHDDASLTEISAYVQQLVASEALVPDPQLEDYLRERGDLPPADPDVRKQHIAAQEAGRKAAAEGLGPSEGERNKGEGAQGAIEKTESGKDDPRQDPKGGQESQAGHSGADPTKSKNGPNKQGAKQLESAPDPITAPWYERLLSQGKLKDALDTARDQMQAAATPAAYDVARTIVASIMLGGKPDLTPPEPLIAAIQAEFERLYQVGHATVRAEVVKQHQALGTRPTHMLADDPPGQGPRLQRAAQRARLAAANVVQEIYSRVHRAAISAIRGGAGLQALAHEAADGALRVEALVNANAAISEGRADAAHENPDVVGGVYTSVLDGNTCDECSAADTGAVESPEDLEPLGPPNPNCAGADRCRCMIVWVLSEDPRALAAMGEALTDSEGE